METYLCPLSPLLTTELLGWDWKGLAVPWAVLLPCSHLLCCPKTGQWESRALGVTRVVVGRWGLCPALPLSS